jgi:hypothetical protein
MKGIDILSNSPNPWNDSVGDESAGGSRSANKPDDLSAILELAENLRARCEAGAERIEKLRIYRVVSFIGSFLALCLAIVVRMSREDVALQKVTTSVIFLGAIFVGLQLAIPSILFQGWINGIRRRLAPDKRAMFELVRIMRETEGALTESKQWSPLERAKFHIQLSRFDIG